MSVLTGVTEFFGMDIGTNGVRAVQLRGTGATKSLFIYGQAELDVRTALSDASEDQAKLSQQVGEFVRKSGFTTKNVAVGIPTSRVFTVVFDMDRLKPEEMAGAIRYQSDSILPTPFEQSKLDWTVIGDSPKDKSKVEVILSSVNRNYVEKRLDMLEAAGLNVIAFEPDALALARSLLPTSLQGGAMILDVGNSASDLVISLKDTPRLIRSIPIGDGSLTHSTATHLNIDETQAQQFLYKFGLSKDKFEGKVYNAAIDIVDSLISEVEKSNKFFKERYGTSVERIIVTGAASVIPEFPVYLANKLGVSVEIGNAWSNVSYPSDQQNELMGVAHRYGVAAGLAERQG